MPQETLSPRSKGATTREKIIRVATDHFAKKGFDQASIQSIAKECSITHTALLYHFGSKHGLFRAAVERAFVNSKDVAAADFEKTDPALRRLAKVLYGHLTWMMVYRAQAEVILLLAYFGSIDHDMSKIYSDYMKSLCDHVESILLSAVRERQISKSLGRAETARMVVDFLNGMLMNELGARSKSSAPEDLRQRVDTFLKAIGAGK